MYVRAHLHGFLVRAGVFQTHISLSSANNQIWKACQLHVHLYLDGRLRHYVFTSPRIVARITVINRIEMDYYWGCV